MPSNIHDDDAGVRHERTATPTMQTVNKQLST